MSVPVAVGRANATAGLSVLFAGSTVILAIAGLQVSGISMMTTMGWASAIMVARHHARCGHSASRAARTGRAAGQQPPRPVHQAAAVRRLAVEVGPLGRASRGPPGALRRQRSTHPRRARHPGVLDAARLHGCRQRRPVDHDPQGLRPHRRRVRDGANGPLVVVVDTSDDARCGHGRDCRDARAPARGRPGVASVDTPVLNQDKSLADHRASHPLPRRRTRRPPSCCSACATT